MTESEGVIKYRLDYRPGELPVQTDLNPLFRWFNRCRRLGLIGRDPDRYQGLAYGNISQRTGRGFVISGTQTGGNASLRAGDLAWVVDFDTTENWLRAGGPSRPSSEAMTHGQVYRAIPEVNAVIHVHSAPIWNHARELGLPMTPPSAAYGTPAMAAAVERLLGTGGRQSTGILAMGGHEDGVVAYGTDMDRAGELLLTTLRLATVDPGGNRDDPTAG